MMRRLLLSLASPIVMSGAAFAADLPSTKAAPEYAPPPPAFSWTGFYIGANAGATGIGSTQTYVDEQPGYENGKGWGFSGGGQIGYNYQFEGSNVVAGIETDFQGSTANSNYYSQFIYGSGSDNNQINLDWWGTARVRLGYAFGNILPYVTGGLAYGHTTDSFNCNLESCGAYPSSSYGQTRLGWTAGAGFEYAITNNLTAKIEGLYTDLGAHTEDGVAAYLQGENYAPGYYTRTMVRFATVRAGLNWKFDFAAPPTQVAADPRNTKAPPPAFSWTGLYVGANAGVTGLSSTQTYGYYVGGDQGYFNGKGWGFSGGGQIGYNYQFEGSNVVAGIETDFQGSTANDSYYSYDVYGSGSENIQTKLDWWSTGRVRLGYAFDNILPYVTGGLAYGHTTDSLSCSCAPSFAYGQTRLGWTAGAGFEYAITNNLTAKIEGLYTDLGLGSSYENPYGTNAYLKTTVSFATVRAGLNWKFDFGAPSN